MIMNATMNVSKKRTTDLASSASCMSMERTSQLLKTYIETPLCHHTHGYKQLSCFLLTDFIFTSGTIDIDIKTVNEIPLLTGISQ
jgi:hypothetical protein